VGAVTDPDREESHGFRRVEDVDGEYDINVF
jgi:hypothetical protein